MTYFYVLQIGGAMSGAYFRTLSPSLASRTAAQIYIEFLDQTVSDYIAIITTSDPDLTALSFEAN